MIPKRLTGRFELVTHFEPGWVLLDKDKRDKYTSSLDIKELGDLNEVDYNDRPTVFVCEPLKSKFEYLAYTDAVPDYWGIFATHVVEIKGSDVNLSKDANGYLSDDVREQLPPEIYHDIATKILLKSNRGGAELFFSPPVGSSAYAVAALARHQAKTLANMADAKSKSSK